MPTYLTVPIKNSGRVLLRKFRINGGNRLNGSVKISGAKNAAVAIIPAVILSDEVCIIENLPAISDVAGILSILTDIGATVKYLDKNTVEINPKGVFSYTVPKEVSEKMRASSYFLGALLGRFRKARVAPPGGCDFGVRPIDLHIKGFQALGATVTIEGGMVYAKASELLGSAVYLDKVSVGATINIMLAAVKAKGLTVIENAAREPHIVDLANFLNSMGAEIMGAGTDIIKIRGVDHLRGTTYSVIPDQIEAGTYMAAAVITKGSITLENVIPKHLESITAKLEEIGATIKEYDEAIEISVEGELKSCSVNTLPHPGFPTDMQPQITAVLTKANGMSVVSEGIWDNRFKYVDQLSLMDAQIRVDGKIAIVTGVEKLKGAAVTATDLRAGAALVIAALAAEGETVIDNIKYIERGYEDIVEKLQNLGADISVIDDIPDIAVIA